MPFHRSSRRGRSLPKWLLATALLAVTGLLANEFDQPGAFAQEPTTAEQSTDVQDESTFPESTDSETLKEVAEDVIEDDDHPAEDHDDDTHHEGDDDHHEEGHGGGHSSVAAPLFAAIVLILLAAKVVGDLFERLGMPAVLGELSVGILLGNIALLSTQWYGGDGWHGLDFLQVPDETDMLAMTKMQIAYHPGIALKLLAEIGVVLLLFEVGLESNVQEMMKVGVSSLLVAILGVVAPMILGVAVGWVLLQHEPWQVSLFLGATLCATSVGITARVLKDLGKHQQRESQIILGAAVIDDVLGLIILAVVSGIIEQGDQFSAMSLVEIAAKAIGFLVVAVVLGSHLLIKPLFKAATVLRGHGLLVTTSLVICFGMAYLANMVGLAPIVGAFAAGLVLDHAHYQNLGEKEHLTLEQALAPLTALLVPIFFVQMGVMVDLTSFADPSVWLLAGAISVVAVIGKQVCSFGVLEKGLNKFAIGLGMIPRGEVGLIFASVGAGLMANGEPVVSGKTYSAIIVMVILTTMVTPPLLKWSLSKPVSAESVD